MPQSPDAEYFWQDDTLRLRAIRPDDWEAHYANRFDTPARRLLEAEVELPPTETEAHQFAEEWADFRSTSHRIMFTIESLAGDNLGGINLNSVDERHGTFSIGLQIDRGHRGHGYGTRAMRILLRYAFCEGRLHKFNAAVMEGNTASIRMLEKLGCRAEGVRRQVHFTQGRYVDDILYGLTRDEFARTDGG
jgi:RimJ/RimL family protein N-acetyltransferase